MKALKFIIPFLMIFFMACNSNNNSSEDASPGVNDTTSSNPAGDAMDAHPDQRQHIPLPDSSNVVGTDTISGSVATPNTGTDKRYNDLKGDSTNKK